MTGRPGTAGRRPGSERGSPVGHATRLAWPSRPPLSLGLTTAPAAGRWDQRNRRRESPRGSCGADRRRAHLTHSNARSRDRTRVLAAVNWLQLPIWSLLRPSALVVALAGSLLLARVPKGFVDLDQSPLTPYCFFQAARQRATGVPREPLNCSTNRIRTRQPSPRQQPSPASPPAANGRPSPIWCGPGSPPRRGR